MRKFRNAAIAGMTAVTLVAGLNTTAFADEASTDTTTEATKDTKPKQEDLIKDTPASKRKSALEDSKKLDEKQCLDVLGEKAAEGKLLNFEGDASLGDLDCQTRAFNEDLKDYVKNPTNSSVWGKRYDGTQDVYGVDLLGQDKNFADQPVWSQIWFVATVLGVIGTAVGIGYLPIMNQLKAMGFIV